MAGKGTRTRIAQFSCDDRARADPGAALGGGARGVELHRQARLGRARVQVGLRPALGRRVRAARPAPGRAGPSPIGPRELLFIGGSGVLHLVYFLLLSQGYRKGDLSLVYPLARGLGPMLSTACAILIFGERPTAAALLGAALIGVGVFILAGDPRRLRGSAAGPSVIFAVVMGLVIAGYTLWDKEAVSGVGIPPILYFYLFIVVRACLLAPYAATRWDQVRIEWRLHWRHALGVAVRSSASYILVLYALAVSPVSYVAPVRAIGILMGTVLGSRVLAEGESGRRMAGAVAMVVGVVAVAVALALV